MTDYNDTRNRIREAQAMGYDFGGDKTDEWDFDPRNQGRVRQEEPGVFTIDSESGREVPDFGYKTEPDYRDMSGGEMERRAREKAEALRIATGYDPFLVLGWVMCMAEAADKDFNDIDERLVALEAGLHSLTEIILAMDEDD